MKDLINKYKGNLIIILLLGFGVYFYIILRHGYKEIASQISQFSGYYLIIIFSLLFLYVFLEGYVIYIFAKEKVTGISLFEAFRINLSTQFFNAITPFSAGGQPFQIFYLSARGIKAKDSTSIVVMNFITYNVAVVIVGFFCLLFKFRYFISLFKGEKLILFNTVQIDYKYILLIGFSVNLAVAIFTLILAFSRRIYHVLVEVIWLKIIHWSIFKRFNLEQKTEKIRETIDGFNHEIKELNQHKKLWVQAILSHVARIILFYMIPLYIFIGLGMDVKNNEVNLIVGAIFVGMVMSYIPTPGASAGAEGIFYIIFKLFSQNIVGTAVIIWRLITYYLYLLFGFIALMTLNYKKDLHFENYQKGKVEVDEI